ncbi:SLATT domain-containing protein [Kribbella sp. NPDC000426]|uniref:SLATT domain-containing protein n=1 Tax=Kribbella sp. NPDC000426 TaxID=3154255 RepID=UPI003324DE64
MSALAVYEWAESQCTEAFDWYMARRVWPSRVSKLLRVMTIALGVIGSGVPFFALASDSHISSDWGYLGLLVAAGCLLGDRAFGFSASWSRYVRTAISIESEIASARAELLSVLAANPLHKDRNGLIAQIAVTLIARTNEAVSHETAEWIEDFRGAQEELRGKAGTLGP